MSNRALIRDLVADLTPVTPRAPWRDAGLLLAVGAAELVLLLGLGMMRRDMAQVAGSPYLLWKMGSLALLGALACTVALRSFSPLTPPRRGLGLATGLAAAAIAAGAVMGAPAEASRSLVDRIAPVHGMLCATAIVVLALPLMVTLRVLMHRAAPTLPESSAVASGLAAGTCSALIFAFCCPMNDPLYIVTWYSVGCAVVIAIARWLLPRRFRL